METATCFFSYKNRTEVKLSPCFGYLPSGTKGFLQFWVFLIKIEYRKKEK
jgi:hypothetical protein